MKQIVILFVFISSAFAGGSGFSIKSPFGNKRFTGAIYSFAKGYAGIASYDPRFINPMNSATWVENRMTSIDFSVEGDFNAVTSSGQTTGMNNVALSSINWVSHVIDSTMSIGFSFSPYLERNGQYTEHRNFQIDTSETNIQFFKDYSGVISEMKFGIAYRVQPKLAISLDALYYFGSLNVEYKFQESGTSVFNRSAEKVERTYYGLTFGVNALYTYDEKTTFALQFSPSVKLTSEAEGVTSIAGRIDNYKLASDTPLEIPTKFNFGVSRKMSNRVSMQFDLRYENWNFVDQTTLGYHLGLETSGSADPQASFFERCKYFVGSYFYNEAYKVNGNDVNNIGLTSGISVPFNNGMNFFMLGLSYSKRGNESDNGIEDSVFKLNLGLSLHEFWYEPESEE
jgi:hypothetical protein